MKTILAFVKKETVLCIAIFLALLSMFFVLPDKEYINYIDIRTLMILFCLMTIVAGMKNMGVFDWFAEKLLLRVRGMTGIVCILVMLCFFSSMFITNDVSLITFVPLTIILMNKMGQSVKDKWMIRIVIMQTVAANLGSMLTPIGNPQNLYLYGKANISFTSFCKLMLPYSAMAWLLLMVWITGANIFTKEKSNMENMKNIFSERAWTGCGKYLISYSILFILSLLAVVHLIPYQAAFLCVLCYVVLCDKRILKMVDYSLLGTFAALFVFIGNLGRIPEFHEMLRQIIDGREVMTAVLSSQVMSNVPAAILLSGFTGQFQALIVGTNLGGLGTLIASMASLISFKYIAKENAALRGKYFIEFTLANIIFLAILLLQYSMTGK